MFVVFLNRKPTFRKLLETKNFANLGNLRNLRCDRKPIFRKFVKYIENHNVANLRNLFYIMIETFVNRYILYRKFAKYSFHLKLYI